MQIAFVAFLVVVFLAAIISFMIIGFRDSRRARRLAREASQRGLRFTREDPFDVPERYADFSLISCGHSPRASNCVYGKAGTWPIRAFDYRYELGHGTRRISRHYGILIADVELPLPDVLMWNDSDAVHAPLDVRQVDGHIATWAYTGDAKLAETLADAAVDWSPHRPNIQIHRGLLMLAVASPEHGRKHEHTDWLDQAMAVLRHVKDYCDSGVQSPLEATNLSET